MDVLVVDDDDAVRTVVRRALVLDGHSVLVATSGETALEMLAERDDFSALVLDVGLDGIDGLEVCRRLRAAGDQVPVLMLTARHDVEDRVAGLDVGADDYLAKPFAIAELRARVRALLRRGSADESRPRQSTVAYTDLVYDPESHRALRAGRELTVTRTEAALLELLLRNPRRVLHRGTIEQHVWGHEFEYGSNSLEVYVSRLRRITEAGGEPRLVQTVRGIGYVLREQ